MLPKQTKRTEIWGEGGIEEEAMIMRGERPRLRDWGGRCSVDGWLDGDSNYYPDFMSNCTYIMRSSMNGHGNPAMIHLSLKIEIDASISGRSNGKDSECRERLQRSEGD